MTICCLSLLLSQKLKTFTSDISHNLLETKLNRNLIQHILKMIQQWSIIDPNSLTFQNGKYRVNVLENVICCVNEKTCDY